MKQLLLLEDEILFFAVSSKSMKHMTSFSPTVISMFLKILYHNSEESRTLTPASALIGPWVSGHFFAALFVLNY